MCSERINSWSTLLHPGWQSWSNFTQQVTPTINKLINCCLTWSHFRPIFANPRLSPLRTFWRSSLPPPSGLKIRDSSNCLSISADPSSSFFHPFLTTPPQKKPQIRPDVPKCLNLVDVGHLFGIRFSITFRDLLTLLDCNSIKRKPHLYLSRPHLFASKIHHISYFPDVTTLYYSDFIQNWWFEDPFKIQWSPKGT